MVFLDQIYSGTYYRYKTMTMEEIPAARTRLQHLYFHNFFIASLITIIVAVLVSIVAEKLGGGSAEILLFYKIWHTLAPSTVVMLIFAFAAAAFMRTRHLNDDVYVRLAICSFPWVIGTVAQGLLMVNLDINEIDDEPKALAKAQLLQLSRIPHMQKALLALLHHGPTKNFTSDKPIKSDEEAYYVLAVCELLKEQDKIGNSAFFNSDTPLENYIKINHQEDV